MSVHDVKEERMEVRLTTEDKEYLESVAAQRGLKVSEVVRRLVEALKKGKVNLPRK